MISNICPCNWNKTLRALSILSCKAPVERATHRIIFRDKKTMLSLRFTKRIFQHLPQLACSHTATPLLFDAPMVRIL